MITFKDYDVKIFTDDVEESAIEQVKRMLSYGLFTDVPIRCMPDIHSGQGVVIGFTAPVKDKVVPNVVGVDICCLDKDTEILTPNGWVKISEYKEGDPIMQFNPETDEGMFLKPFAYIKAPCETFNWFHNSKGMDQMVSDEHNLLVYQGYKNKGYSYRKMTPRELEKCNLDKGYYGFKTCFNIVNNPGLNISDDLIRIDVMIQADGRIVDTKDHNHIELHFRKERKIERAKMLLESANITYNTYTLKDGSTTISFNIDKSFNKDLKRYYLATKEQLEVVCSECVYWDGYNGENKKYYYSTNKENIDVIQFAYSATNIRAGIYTKIFDNEKLSDSYTVIPTKNSVVAYSKKSEIVKSEDGFKYCFMTDTGYFVCRRNGKIFITGNCGMYVYPFKPTEKAIDFHTLTDFILHNIPSGNAVRSDKFKQLSQEFIQAYQTPSKEFIKQLKCNRDLSDPKRLYRAIGSLGGGEALNCLQNRRKAIHCKTCPNREIL